MTVVLGIPSTADYGDFESALKQISQSPIYRGDAGFPSSVDYAAKYKEALEDVFCYDVYADGEDCIVKLKFDYLKHHTTVGFPAAILLKEEITAIPYTITSRNSAEIVEGKLMVDNQ